jgi:hypothetical protein
MRIGDACQSGKVLDFFEADDGRGVWTIKERSQLRKQWRWVRRAPVIVQIITALFALTWFMLWFFATWLVVGGLTVATGGDRRTCDRTCDRRTCDSLLASSPLPGPPSNSFGDPRLEPRQRASEIFLARLLGHGFTAHRLEEGGREAHGRR